MNTPSQQGKGARCIAMDAAALPSATLADTSSGILLSHSTVWWRYALNDFSEVTEQSVNGSKRALTDGEGT